MHHYRPGKGTLLLFVLAVMLLGLAYKVRQPIFRVQKSTLLNHADASRLRASVTTISLDHYLRSWDHPDKLAAVAAYLADSFRASGARVTEQIFQVDGREYINEIASFGPEQGERIIVGAHYDAFSGYPGADDNATGTAGLLELARMLSHADLKRRVDLVAYTLEEPPFFRTEQMGSAVHAESIREQHIPVKAMVCLEMIGTFRDEPGSQSYPISALGLIYPHRGNFIAVVGTFDDAALVRTVKRSMAGVSDLPVYSMDAPRALPGVDFSDHLNYWNRNITAVMITDTAFYRNPRYHHANDTPEKIDYVRMAQVVDQVSAAVMGLANEE